MANDAPRLATYFAVSVLFTAFSYKALSPSSLLRHTAMVPPGHLPPPRAQYYSLMARRVPEHVTSAAVSRGGKLHGPPSDHKRQSALL